MFLEKERWTTADDDTREREREKKRERERENTCENKI